MHCGDPPRRNRGPHSGLRKLRGASIVRVAVRIQCTWQENAHGLGGRRGSETCIDLSVHQRVGPVFFRGYVCGANTEQCQWARCCSSEISGRARERLRLKQHVRSETIHRCRTCFAAVGRAAISRLLQSVHCVISIHYLLINIEGSLQAQYCRT